MRAFAKAGRVVGAVLATTFLVACSGGTEKSKTSGATPSSTSAASPAANSTDTLSGASLAQFPGDAAAGQAVFAQCQACHSVQAGQNRIGPSLHAIVGAPAGRVAGFSYSPANRDSGITWTPEKLFQFLENPQRVMPGTRMAFAGIADPQRRANLIAWLGTQR